MKKLKKIPRLFLKFIFLPFYLIGKLLKSKKKLLIKIFGTSLITFIFLPIWYGLFLFVFLILIGNVIGYPIEVVGNSMLPTFTSNSLVRMYSYPGFLGFRKLQREDIVTFADNNESDPSKNLIKRVIGLPGDIVEVRDQMVYLNGEILSEPYIAGPNSTYGGTKINECQITKIPDDKILVMGDNRKLSKDSREIGLIFIKDVNRVLPYTNQNSYFSRWRNTSKDKEVIEKSNLDTQKYLDFLNKIRKEKNLKPLAINDKLSKSAELRAEAILQYDDITWKATISGYPMTRSMSDAGYYNVIYGEYPLLGYYTTNELIAYEKEYPKVIDFFMNKDYQDIGISSYKGSVNGCPTHIIVQQVAGYIPPNYNADNTKSWADTLAKLKEILPSWAEIKNYSLTYNNNKTDIDRLLEILNYRISMLNTIVDKMENNQWLNNNENVYLKQDLSLYNEQESIAKKLNDIHWQH